MMLTKSVWNKKLALSLLGFAYALTAASCVDHRPLRTEVYNENIYLSKEMLTRENPLRPDSGDSSWLYWAVITKTSVPFAFENAPYIGQSSTARNVKLRFTHSKLEMIDDTDYVGIDDDSSAVETVLQAWPGEHVDIKMKVNLDGEVTTVKEENKETDWEDRQFFKVDLEKSERPDINMVFWAMDEYYMQCLQLKSVSLVPGSLHIEQDADKPSGQKGDDIITWTMALTYEQRVIDGQYYCYEMLSNRMDRSSYTIHVKQSLWRLPESDYEPIEMAEKDPIRKVVGAFDTALMGGMDLYRDHDTDLFGARSYMMRFDPEKELHTFYFAANFPDKYKEHFTDVVAKQVNDLMEENKVKMRIRFEEHDFDGKVREFGDPRYSMLVFHKTPGNTMPIGMAGWVYDRRTGEVYSSLLNMYDWIDDHYANLLQDYLAQVTKDTFGEAEPAFLKEKCDPGDPEKGIAPQTVKLDYKKIQESQASTSLYSKLTQYMEEPPVEWVKKRSDDFHAKMRMLLPELRYAVPWWNGYVDGHTLINDLFEAERTERQFKSFTDKIDRGESPFGEHPVASPEGIKAGLDAISKTKQFSRNHQKLMGMRRAMRGLQCAETLEHWELATAMQRSARMCKSDGKWESREEWSQRIVDTWFKVFATHEFGHDLGLRHNFYGSLDAPHQHEGETTSSIMEYAYTLSEAALDPRFKQWDIMSLKYIYAGVKPDKNEGWLYCTDEHADISPLCTRHDIGTTPTAIVKNAIDIYEWQYHFRNFRAYRKFWSTQYYYSSMFGQLYPLRRFLNLWAIDWAELEVKNDLLLLGVEGDENYFENLMEEFDSEMAQANRLIVNFYKAILQQSAGERTYATRFDTFYGDVTQQGIILDKYFSLFFFLGLWPVDDYDQNIYAYLAFHESNRNSLFWSNAEDTTDSMLGGQYDVYPWFQPLAVLLFAQDTHDINFGDRAKEKWIEIRSYERVEDMITAFGFNPLDVALKIDNPYQYFTDQKGGTWVYYYLADRNQHLVASKDHSPISFKLLKDQNESLNIDKAGYVDDFEIKYFLDYYQYFN